MNEAPVWTDATFTRSIDETCGATCAVRFAGLSVSGALPIAAPVLEKSVDTAAQLVHALVPVAKEYCPTAQPMQAVDADSPVVVKYRPAAQLVHALVPVATAY